MARLIDAENYRNLFNEEFKKTMELIRKGETHLDTLAEGFTEADRVIRALPTIDPVTAAAEALGMSPDRLRELAQAEKTGQFAKFPFIAMVEQSLRDGTMKPMSDQKHNGRYAVVYKSERWTFPLIDICGTPYNTEQAVEQMREISREAAEAALEEREAIQNVLDKQDKG